MYFESLHNIIRESKYDFVSGNIRTSGKTNLTVSLGNIPCKIPCNTSAPGASSSAESCAVLGVRITTMSQKLKRPHIDTITTSIVCWINIFKQG